MLYATNSCAACKDTIKACNHKVWFMQQQIHDLQDKVDVLEEKCANIERNAAANAQKQVVESFHGGTVTGEEFAASDLIVKNFDTYHNSLLQKYPALQSIAANTLSITHQHKAKASDTSSQWHQWAALYKTFILEVILRSKNAKATFRTPILLGLVCIYANVSDSAWNILRILCIISSRQTIEKWVREQPTNEVSDSKVVLFSFDNCDFYQHVANTRSNHCSTWVHSCTHFVAELCSSVVVAVDKIRSSVVKDDFVDFLHCDFDFSNVIANESFVGVNFISKHSWLKLAPIPGCSCACAKKQFCHFGPYYSMQHLHLCWCWEIACKLLGYTHGTIREDICICFSGSSLFCSCLGLEETVSQKILMGHPSTWWVALKLAHLASHIQDVWYLHLATT